MWHRHPKSCKYTEGPYSWRFGYKKYCFLEDNHGDKSTKCWLGTIFAFPSCCFSLKMLKSKSMPKAFLESFGGLFGLLNPRLPKSSKYLVSRCLEPLKAFSGGIWKTRVKKTIWPYFCSHFWVPTTEQWRKTTGFCRVGMKSYPVRRIRRIPDLSNQDDSWKVGDPGFYICMYIYIYRGWILTQLYRDYKL